MSAKPPLLTADMIRRGALACLGIAIVSLGFIASYAGALHAPTPHDVKVAVTAQVPTEVVRKLDASSEVEVARVGDAAAATRAIDRGKAYGSIGLSNGGGFLLTTAPAASAGVATFLGDQVGAQLRQTGKPVDTAVAHRLPAADSRGVVAFYVVAGWVIAGYLGATLLGLSFGEAPRGRPQVLLRIGTLALLGLVIGLFGTLIAKGIGDLGGPWFGLALLGALTVSAAGAATIALQSLFGLVGTGLAILLFVVLGNPSSGGPAATEFLASPWREFGQAIPVGAGVTAFRDAVYFPDAPLTTPLLTLAAWFVAGSVIALAWASRAKEPSETDAELAAVAV